MQGFFGKLPSLGDFVTRELPRDFLDRWDDWLQQSMAESKATLGDAWLHTYLNCPIWRFVLLPGVCGDGSWAGIVMPSVDKVGRYFPLTIASSVDDNAQPFQIVEGASQWFDSAESLALTVLHEDKVDPDTLASSVAALDNQAMQSASRRGPLVQGGEWGLKLSGANGGSFSSAICHELVRFQVGSYSIWWSAGSDQSASIGLVTPDMPAPQCFVSFLRGDWDETPEVPEEKSTVELTGEAS